MPELGSSGSVRGCPAMAIPTAILDPQRPFASLVSNGGPCPLRSFPQSYQNRYNCKCQSTARRLGRALASIRPREGKDETSTDRRLPVRQNPL
jgi:hypothetical protein